MEIHGMDFYVLLTVYIVAMICGIFFSFFRMKTHAHAGDTVFGKSRFARTMVVIGVFLWVI